MRRSLSRPETIGYRAKPGSVGRSEFEHCPRSAVHQETEPERAVKIFDYNERCPATKTFDVSILQKDRSDPEKFIVPGTESRAIPSLGARAPAMFAGENFNSPPKITPHNESVFQPRRV